MKSYSKLSQNILFIGNKLYTLPESKKLIKFNMSALARDFGVTQTSINKWINTGKISKTTLNRISKITSELLNIEITPQMLLEQDLSQIFIPSKIKDVEILYGIDKQIFDLLNKHKNFKKAILTLLQQYDIHQKGEAP